MRLADWRGDHQRRRAFVARESSRKLVGTQFLVKNLLQCSAMFSRNRRQGPRHNIPEFSSGWRCAIEIEFTLYNNDTLV